jgi:hypothetical protein
MTLHQASSFEAETVCHLIHEYMKDLKTNKHHAILCRETKLAPTIGNKTRWASTTNMLNKFEKIEDAIANANTEMKKPIFKCLLLLPIIIRL